MTHHQDSLKEVVEKLGMTYMYADLNDANLGIDKVESVDYPVFVYIAPSKKQSSVDSNNNIKRKVTISCLILDKPKEQISSGFTYPEVQSTIRGTEVMADRLIHALNQHSTTDHETDGIEEFDYTDTYSEFDISLFGVFLNFLWPVNEGTRGC